MIRYNRRDFDMTTHQQQHFYEMRRQFREAHLKPALDLMLAANAAVEDAERRAVEAEATLEALRPVWAQGWTSDSQAAQASSNALSELWELLGATNQTVALERLRNLLYDRE